jgi:hypothetical protein
MADKQNGRPVAKGDRSRESVRTRSIAGSCDRNDHAPARAWRAILGYRPARVRVLAEVDRGRMAAGAEQRISLVAHYRERVAR